MARLQFDRFVFDPSDATLLDTDSGASLTLRPQLARLLEAFLAQPETVIDRESLCRKVWGEEAVVDFESGLAALIKELRQALGERADGSRLLQTLPRRGFRLNATVRRYSRWRAIRSQAPLVLAAAVIGTLLLLLLMGRASSPWLGPQQPDPRQQTEWVLAVLPLENYASSVALQQHLQWLVADNLLANLWQAELEGLELLGRTSIRPYADSANPLAELSEALDVQLLIEGSVESDGPTAQVNLRMLLAPGGQVVWQFSHSQAAEQLRASDVAQAAADDLAEAWPDLRQSLIAPVRAANPE